MSEADTSEGALRVAIVGAGPAGFYAAGHLLAGERPVTVDLFDRLPTPFGLVRAGVAPDHPKIKSVVRIYEKTAAKEGFRFFGGVELGRDLHRTDLLARYPVTAEVCWVQEEPRNMGAWTFVQQRMQPLLDSSRRTLRYIGRAEGASPSAGALKRHLAEQAEIVEESFAATPLPRKIRRLVPKKKK